MLFKCRHSKTIQIISGEEKWSLWSALQLGHALSLAANPPLCIGLPCLLVSGRWIAPCSGLCVGFSQLKLWSWLVCPFCDVVMYVYNLWSTSGWKAFCKCCYSSRNNRACPLNISWHHSQTPPPHSTVYYFYYSGAQGWNESGGPLC